MNTKSVLFVLLISVFALGAVHSYSIGMDNIFQAEEDYAKYQSGEDSEDTEAPTDPPTTNTDTTTDTPPTTTTTTASAATAVSSLLTFAAAFFLL